jgi:hypothetical protein
MKLRQSPKFISKTEIYIKAHNLHQSPKFRRAQNWKEMIGKTIKEKTNIFFDKRELNISIKLLKL